MVEKRYLIFFLFPICLALAGNVWHALANDPIDGDLTRMGGYMESQYGWNGAQERFLKSDVDYAADISGYDRPYDVVVIGDSFTFKGNSSWLDYFAQATQLSVIAFKDNRVAVADVLRSKQFQQAPPRLFIYEMVERNVLARVEKELRLGLGGDENEASVDIQRGQSQSAAKMHLAGYQRESYFRRKEWRDLNEAMGEGFHFWGVNIHRSLFGGASEVVRKLLKPEYRGKLFSSKDQNSVLLLAEDFRVRQVQASAQEKTALGVKAIRQAVELNGKTAFLHLVMPDKLTVYQDFLENIEVPREGVLELLGRRLDSVRLDIKYGEVIRAGGMDVYAPNNTHTSSLGDRIAAQEVVRRLRQDHSLNDILTVP